MKNISGAFICMNETVSLGDTAISLHKPAARLIRGVVVQANIPEILEWGHSRNFAPKILEA